MSVKLKKGLTTAICTLFTVVFAATMTACVEDDNGDKETIKVTYNYNYDGAPASVEKEVEYGDVAEEIDGIERENFVFTYWFTSAECTKKFDFEEVLYEDTEIFAGWTQIACDVTFVANYAGGKDTVKKVAVGTNVTMPDDPDREGHLFTGWYKDSSCNTEYDFSTVVNEDVKVYAGWEEVSGTLVNVTFYNNYDGAENEKYYSTKIKQYRKAKQPAAPVRDNYYFSGWFTDTECTIKYDFGTNVRDNLNLYAGWFTKYTFEAEYTDLRGKEGNGYSSSAAGTDLIMNDIGGEVGKNVGQAGASNGFYLASLYNPNLSIDFEFTSDEAVENAVLILRLSVEYYDMLFNSQNFKIMVNGSAIADYPAMDIKGAVDVAEENVKGKRPFTDYTITTTLSLKEGKNIIKLVIANETDLGGTMYAEAPMIDCIYVCTDSTLSWTPVTDNLNGKI